MAKRSKVSTKEIELRKNPINEFTCCGETMKLPEFRDHLLRVHKVQAAKMKGKKQMLMHMDGDYWFSYNWQWELENGVKFTQYTEMARELDDPMRF